MQTNPDVLRISRSRPDAAWRRQRAVVLTVEGYSQTEIAKELGVHRQQVCAWLKEPDVAQVLKRTKYESTGVAVRIARACAVEAVQIIAEVMVDPESTTMERMRAACIILDRGGLTKEYAVKRALKQAEQEQQTSKFAHLSDEEFADKLEEYAAALRAGRSLGARNPVVQ